MALIKAIFGRTFLPLSCILVLSSTVAMAAPGASDSRGFDHYFSMPNSGEIEGALALSGSKYIAELHGAAQRYWKLLDGLVTQSHRPPQTQPFNYPPHPAALNIHGQIEGASVLLSQSARYAEAGILLAEGFVEHDDPQMRWYYGVQADLLKALQYEAHWLIDKLEGEQVYQAVVKGQFTPSLEPGQVNQDLVLHTIRYFELVEALVEHMKEAELALETIS